MLQHVAAGSLFSGANSNDVIPGCKPVSKCSILIEQDIHAADKSWAGELEEIKRGTVDRRSFDESAVNPNTLVQTLSAKMNDDAVYVADVGQNQLWSADNYVMKEGRFLTTGGMGTMGYSIPAAIGAKFYAPERQTVAVCGDGAFQMCMNELATVRENDLDVKVLIVRNGYLGLVREYQEKNYDSHYEGVKLGCWPQYDKIAAAYDMPYFYCSSNEELDAELDRFLGSDGASLMVCDISSENNVN